MENALKIKDLEKQVTENEFAAIKYIKSLMEIPLYVSGMAGCEFQLAEKLPKWS